VLDASPAAKQTSLPHVIKNVNGVKVGIVSFGAMPPDPTGARNEYEVRKSLYRAYKSARAEADVLVVLDQANMVNKEWIERNAARLGSPDIVIGGITNTAMAKERVIGRTHIVPTSPQAKSLGVVDVEVSGGEIKMASRLLALDEAVAEDEAVAKVANAVMGTTTAMPSPSVMAPVGKDNQPIVAYAPPETCKTCHAKQYGDWAKTNHARAIKTLTAKVQATPECLGCHSEKFRRTQQAGVPQGDVGGVDCGSCHYEALPHGAERAKVVAKTTVSPKMCVTCHTKEWSPNFDEKSYMTKVTHSAARVAKTAAK
jgi:predicted CXXCH cytochrome family protein